MGGHTRDGVGLTPGCNAPGQFAERLRNGRSVCPNGILNMSPSFCKFSEIFLGQYYPLRPNPILIWPPDPDIENQPVQSSSTDIRVAEFMKLPGTGKKKIARM